MASKGEIVCRYRNLYDSMHLPADAGTADFVPFVPELMPLLHTRRFRARQLPARASSKQMCVRTSREQNEVRRQT